MYPGSQDAQHVPRASVKARSLLATLLLAALVETVEVPRSRAEPADMKPKS